ncbi:MAG TPA: hypothetical protein VNT56_04960 [Acidimicrobiales bacterium]|nr:hypothetical protein [Acidimicrobiales bacterium]
MLLGATLVSVGLGQAPVDATHLTVTAVQGSAYGCFGNTSIFGNPPVVTGPLPSVDLPPGGSAVPITAEAPLCDIQVFPGGPFVVSTGPLAVSTQGTTGPTGSVTSTATITDVNRGGQEALDAESISSTCTADESGLTGSTTVINGTVQTDADAPDGAPVAVPVNPPPGHTIFADLGVGTSNYIFNEQIINPDGSITVNAVRIEPLTGPLTGTVILGQVVCGVTTEVTTTTTSTSTTLPPTSTTSTSTTSTSTTLPPTSTTSTSTTLPDDGLVGDIGDEVRTNGNRGQVTVVITCDAGSLFLVEVEITQGAAQATGRARGACTGSPQEVTVGFATAGAGFTDGPAQACATARVGDPNTKTVTETDEDCEEVTVEVT